MNKMKPLFFEQVFENEQGQDLNLYRQITVESTWKILYDLNSSFPLDLVDWGSILA